MTQQSAINHWIKGAQRMFIAAKHCVDSADYEVALFTLHLAIEKMLKAKCIAFLNQDPPKTHDLYELCTIMEITLIDEQIKE